MIALIFLCLFLIHFFLHGMIALIFLCLFLIGPHSHPLLLSRVSTTKKHLNCFQFPKQEKKSKKKHKTQSLTSRLFACLLACLFFLPSFFLCLYFLSLSTVFVACRPTHPTLACRTLGAHAMRRFSLPPPPRPVFGVAPLLLCLRGRSSLFPSLPFAPTCFGPCGPVGVLPLGVAAVRGVKGPCGGGVPPSKGGPIYCTICLPPSLTTPAPSHPCASE